MSAAPDAQLWTILHGALATRTLGIAADLRIADAPAGGPRPVAELEAQWRELLGATGWAPELMDQLIVARPC